MSTITIEAYIPGKIDLSPTFYSRADSAEVKWANSSGMTSGKGSVKSTIVSTRLDNIGTVAVSLKIKESTD
jgi:hypothetical protein